MATAPIVADPQTRVEYTINPFRAAWLRFEPPVLVVQMAFAIALTMTRNWNAWEGGRAEQVTDDAIVRRDVTLFGTKVAGLVRSRIGERQASRGVESTTSHPLSSLLTAIFRSANRSSG
jgi:hypothetical protein